MTRRTGINGAQISLRLNKRLLERADALIDFYAQRQSNSGLAQQADVLRKSIEIGLATMEGYAADNAQEEEAPPQSPEPVTSKKRNIKTTSKQMVPFFASDHLLPTLAKMQIDPNSATGRLLIATMVELDESIGFGLSAVTGAKRLRLKKGTIPYGYRRSSNGKYAEEDPREQEIILLARRMRKEGYTLNEISRQLEAQGFLSRVGRCFARKQISYMTDGRVRDDIGEETDEADMLPG